MPIYRQSTWRSYDNSGATDSDCVVRITGTEIVVEFEGDGPNVWHRYVGEEEGEGHYHLICPELNGTATLHRFKDVDVLEGHWKEGGEIGMWTIELSNEE